MNHPVSSKYRKSNGGRVVFATLLFILFCSASASAQDNEFKKKYDEFKEKAQQTYENFRLEVNKRYADFLRDAWKSYQEMPAIPLPPEPKVKPVVFKDDGNKRQDKQLPIDTVITIPGEKTEPKPIGPVPEIENSNERTLSFSFYGAPCKVRYPKEAFHLNSLDGESLADTWMQLVDDKYNNTLRDCEAIRLKLAICDWAYMELTQAAAKACCQNANDAAMLAGFLLCQSGYQVRFGTVDNELLLLVNCDNNIIERNYYNINGKRFYVVNSKRDGCIKISNMDEESNIPLSMEVNTDQLFPSGTDKMRTLKSETAPEVTATIHCNTNLVDFFNTYPRSIINGDFTTLWPFYANTPLSETVKKDLYPALRQHIEGKSQLQAVSVLLDFVQTSLVYKHDEEVWGYDRPFFPDETVSYPYCDCEDRAILLSRLVRDLLDMDVVLIFHPGHLYTGIRFDEDVKGDYIMCNGQRYVICDPTYIYAPVGATMPGMDNSKAVAIVIKKN